MALSKSGKAAFAGSALLIQAVVVMPVLAAEAAPLDDAVLSNATAPGVGDVVPPDDQDQAALPSKGDDNPPDRNRNSVARIVQSGAMELPRDADSQAGLGAVLRPASFDFFGANRNGTNFVFGATLTGFGNLSSPQP